jgi:hypothetical protein
LIDFTMWELLFADPRVDAEKACGGGGILCKTSAMSV